MLRNYLLVAFRSLKRNMGFSLINIIGLATGMAASILILFWVTDEVNYDRFHNNINEIYRVYEHQAYSGTDDLLVYNTPAQLAPELKEQFPSIKRVARFSPIWQRSLISIDDKQWYIPDGYFADPEAFELFTFDFVLGNPQTALSSPNSIVITTEIASMIFGHDDPLGKSININRDLEYTVTGVIDRPENTHLRFSYVITFDDNVAKFWEGVNLGWQSNSFFTYLQIGKEQDDKAIEEQIANVVADNGQSNVTLYLEPLKRSYLHNIWGTGAIANVRIFSVIAVLVLLIACINFMNLTTARSAQRAKEVGLRKVAGGNKLQLVGQFLGESILLTILSLAFAIVLVAALLPSFNDLSGKALTLGSLSAVMVIAIVLIALFTGMVSGSYPAFYLSSFIPIKVLKGQLSKGSKTFRTVLVVFQFTLSVALIISTIMVSRQLEYMTNKNLGFQKDNIVVASFNAGGRAKFDILKQELLKLPGVESVTCSNALPNQIGNSTSGASWEGQDPDETVLFSNILVHYDFIDVYGMKIVEGRTWDPELASDSLAMVINQETARIMGFDTPVGKTIELWGYSFEVIGVVENFNFQSLKNKVEPLIMFMAVPWQNMVSIRIKPESIVSTMESVEAVWNDIYPQEMFRYSFFDQSFDRMYRAEMRMMKIFSYFSFLAILISCLGLFGLATYMAEQRFKEIGIRKTLGATEWRVVLLMVWDFIKWVIVANFAGWILAYYAVESWLRGYAYRIDVSPWVFVIAGAVSVAIAIATVSYQAWKASRANPVLALKYE
ncbi:ABC transporter permease [Perlabentimonas gracilis]|uniref:ABC transporter permease n=1 Tax=Perlabentimonas gracilis TaxID=2715279 RepID=UPI001408A0A1|nr:ABC transporter permease [Perlabentimonas gracilis]NHB67769.1 FtsX-like permease family protein [Perlabentimonas gracilis]